MQYNGEHIAIGFAGQILVYISILALFASLICYIFSCQEKLINFRSWRFYGRHWFRIHFASVIGAMAVLLYLLIGHHYEYKYVWEHTSSDLSLGYLISALWAGQEGSILLWLFFQGLIGVLLLKRTSDFERPVMIVFSSAQIFLNITLLGKVAGIQLGNDPFILLRQSPENISNPFFLNPDYLQSITTGLGLNPLLQNFWMKAHPPILLLGFASALVPFAYAFAALWKSKYTGWLKPVLPWMSFAIFSLGTGLLMGGAWAYEDLTFGGFWSWDPVENSSLVPWLILIAALHLVMVSLVNKQSLFPAFLLSFLSYSLVLYSALLTRSGWLGATSAHAFSKSGTTLYLSLFLITFFAASLILLLFKKSKFPKSEDEKLLSRELWMFIGCVAIMLSGFQILFSTSAPVFNKFFGTSYSIGANSLEFYNDWQLPFAILILFMIFIAQYLLYGMNFTKVFIKKILPSLVVSIILVILFYLFSDIGFSGNLLLAGMSFLVIFSSIDIMLRFFRFSRNFSSLLGHMGLGIFVFGIILSFSQSKTISSNNSIQYPDNGGNLAEKIGCYKDTVVHSAYFDIQYLQHDQINNETFYKIKFIEKCDNNDKRQFFIEPSVISTSMGSVVKPDTKHQFARDIFTYVVFAEDGGNDANPLYDKVSEEILHTGDTLRIGASQIILDGIIKKDNDTMDTKAFFHIPGNDTLNDLILSVEKKIIDGQNFFNDADLRNNDMKIRLQNVQHDESIVIGLYKRKNDIVIIKSVIFPYIKVLWMGGILILTSFLLSVIKRRKYRMPVENNDNKP